MLVSSSLRVLSATIQPQSRGRLESVGRLRAKPDSKVERVGSTSVTKPAEQAEDELDLSSDASNTSPSPAVDGELTPEQKEQVEELKARDREVRTHEQAHKAAAGPYARGGPTYEYQLGPDGQRYAIGGEVQIDTAPVPGDPEATIQKARIVRAAALAPAEPSSQDRAVAAAATQLEHQAIAESQQQSRENNGTEEVEQPALIEPPESNRVEQDDSDDQPPTSAEQGVEAQGEPSPNSNPQQSKTRRQNTFVQHALTRAFAQQSNIQQTPILDLIA